MTNRLLSILHYNTLLQDSMQPKGNKAAKLILANALASLEASLAILSLCSLSEYSLHTIDTILSQEMMRVTTPIITEIPTQMSVPYSEIKRAENLALLFGVSEQSLQILRGNGFMTTKAMTSSKSTIDLHTQSCDAFYNAYVEIPQCRKRKKRGPSKYGTTNNNLEAQTSPTDNNKMATLTFLESMTQVVSMIFEMTIANGVAHLSRAAQVFSLLTLAGVFVHQITMAMNEGLDFSHKYWGHELALNQTLTQIQGTMLSNAGQKIRNKITKLDLDEKLSKLRKKTRRTKAENLAKKSLELSREIVTEMEDQTEDIANLSELIKVLTGRIEKLEEAPLSELPTLDEKITNYFRSSKHGFREVTDIKLALTAFANPDDSDPRIWKVFQNNQFLLTSLVNYALRYHNTTLHTERFGNSSVSRIILECDNPPFTVSLVPEQINPQKMEMTNESHVFNVAALYNPDSESNFPDFFTPANMYYDSTQSQFHYLIPEYHPDKIALTKVNQSGTDNFRSFKVKCVLAFANTSYFSYPNDHTVAKARETMNSDWLRGVRPHYYLHDNVKVETLDDKNLAKYPISYERFIFGFHTQLECQRYFAKYRNLKWHTESDDSYPTFTFRDIVTPGVLLTLVNVDRAIMKDFNNCLCSCKREPWISFADIKPNYKQTFLSDCLCFNSQSVAVMLSLQHYQNDFSRFPDFQSFVFNNDIDRLITVHTTTLSVPKLTTIKPTTTLKPDSQIPFPIKTLEKRQAPIRPFFYDRYRPTTVFDFNNHTQIFQLAKLYGDKVFLLRQLTHIQEDQLYESFKHCNTCPIERVVSMYYVTLLHSYHQISDKLERLIDTGKIN